VCHRVKALERLGHHVVTLDSADFIGNHGYIRSFIHYRTGYRLLQGKLLTRIRSFFVDTNHKPDLIWVDSGQYLGATIIRWLRSYCACPILLYCNDDPTGPRDWPRYASLRRAIPYYDLCVYRREINELEWLALGARKVLRVWMSYDEIIHLHSSYPDSLAQEVLFIGTNIATESRGSFLSLLVHSSVPLAIYGSRWNRSRFWRSLRSFYLGGSLADANYANRLSKSLLCLGMLSVHNRDLHTRRSVEVPSAGGTLIAERTSEHKLLYEESVDAIFWSSLDECIFKCKLYLDDPFSSLSIRDSGHSRVLSLGVGNEDICKQILAALHF